MENPMKMDDLGGKNPYSWFNTQMFFLAFLKSLCRPVSLTAFLQVAGSCSRIHEVNRKPPHSTLGALVDLGENRWKSSQNDLILVKCNFLRWYHPSPLVIRF